jgi:hypothetical protein
MGHARNPDRPFSESPTIRSEPPGKTRRRQGNE